MKDDDAKLLGAQLILDNPHATPEWRAAAKQIVDARALYVVRCTKAWDGDAFGNEWTCGARVLPDVEGAGFAVFEDDGEGNGNHLVTFALESDARTYADRYVKHLDARAGGIDLPFGLEDADALLQAFCACGRVVSQCDRSRRACRRRP